MMNNRVLELENTELSLLKEYCQDNGWEFVVCDDESKVKQLSKNRKSESRKQTIYIAYIDGKKQYIFCHGENLFTIIDTMRWLWERYDLYD